MKNSIKTTIFLLLLIVLPTSPVWAHKAYLFAWFDGDKVQTKSKLSGGKPVNRGQIIVYTTDGVQILEGRTDAKGEFSFPLKQPKPLKIVLVAGEGHRAEWLFQDEMPAEAETETPAPDQPVLSPQKVVESPSVDCKKQALTNADLDKKLEPIHRTLAELTEDKPTIQDILGGIGYIIGLVGLAAYFQSRKR